jgi:hypothetical protein
MHRAKRVRVENCRLKEYDVQFRKVTTYKNEKLNKDDKDAGVFVDLALKDAIAGLFCTKESPKLAALPPPVPKEKPQSFKKRPSVPFYYGDSARFTSDNKLYVDFEHMFETVVLPHNLASSAYMEWIRSGGPESFQCFDISCPPIERTRKHPFNVCLHAECRKEKGVPPCTGCNTPSLQCASEEACKRRVEHRTKAFRTSLAGYSKEEKITTCSEFWHYMFAGENKLPEKQRSKTQQEMLLRVWKLRPKAMFFLEHVFNPVASPKGVIKIK